MSNSSTDLQHLAAFVRNLEQKPLCKRIETVTGAVLETGGTWEAPRANPTRNVHLLYEIGLFGCTGYGQSTAEAVNNWMRCAKALCSDPDQEVAA